jgi:hypothetical protein
VALGTAIALTCVEACHEGKVHISNHLTALFLALACATPAYAVESVVLPEPSALFLLALGVAGVAIGRKFSTKRPRD